MAGYAKRTEFAPPEVFASLDEQLNGLTSKFPDAHVTPEYVDTKAMDVDLCNIAKTIRDRTELWHEGRIEQDSARVTIDTKIPVHVVGMSDIHFGSTHSDLGRFLNDMHYILVTPGVYVFFLSNLIDNAIPSQFPDGMLHNAIPPEDQVVAMRKYIMDLDGNGKVLGAIVSPCHEGWTWKKAGQDINKLLFGYDGRQFPVLQNGSLLELQVGEVMYGMALYHQLGPFNSNLNKNNGTQRMKQLQHPEADIVAAGHHHTGEAMATYIGRDAHQQQVVYLRTGTYKLEDTWAKGRGYIGGEPSGESVVLWADTKRMLPILDLETAARVYSGIFLTSMLDSKGIRYKDVGT